MQATKQRNQQRKAAGNRNDNLALLSASLRFGGEYVALVDEDLATAIFSLADADGFDPKTHAQEHEWHWVQASSTAAIEKMATKVREHLGGKLN